MTYNKKYSHTDFLAIISDVPCTTIFLMKELGCSRSTAQLYLQQLELEGRIKRIEIRGGNPAYVKHEEV